MYDPADPARILAGKFEDIAADFDANIEATLYIRSSEVMRVKDKTLDDFAHISLLPDEAVFEKDKFVARASEEDPRSASAEAEAEGGEEITPPEVWLYVWVEEKEPTQTTPPETTKPPAPSEIDIFVEARDYVPAAWSCVEPSFTLSGIPQGEKGYSYATIAYDERFIILSGESYTSRDEGEYTLRFAILDGIGDVMALSTRYDVKLDTTPPSFLTVSLAGEGSPEFTLASGDELSGLDAFSVDGGQTWTPASEEGTYTHVGALGQVYAQGMLLARDVAGNVLEYPTDFQIPKPIEIPSYGGGGGGGGGGSGDGSGTSIKHTGDEDVDTTPYDALELTVSREPMHRLTVGEAPLALTLEYDAVDGAEPPEGEAMFTAALARWKDIGLKLWYPGDEDAQDETGDDANAAGDGPDTLLLTAELDPAFEGDYAYVWRFNGAVYRMLFNSGVEYMVFRVGDRVTALSTAGFTAGTEYTRLKAGGVSTRKFDYTIWMSGSTLDPETGEMAVEAQVEEEVYPLDADQTSSMYYYDLYYGPTQLLDVPFGAWPPQEHPQAGHADTGEGIA